VKSKPSLQIISFPREQGDYQSCLHCDGEVNGTYYQITAPPGALHTECLADYTLRVISEIDDDILHAIAVLAFGAQLTRGGKE
jgi:hypothetical protein